MSRVRRCFWGAPFCASNPQYPHSLTPNSPDSHHHLHHQKLRNALVPPTLRLDFDTVTQGGGHGFHTDLTCMDGKHGLS